MVFYQTPKQVVVNKDKNDRVWATYLHACLKYVQRESLTNSSLRERFAIQKENSATISRIIKEAVEASAVKPVEIESESRRHAKYVPFWA
jgi:predicted HTH transcriptional regulator